MNAPEWRIARVVRRRTLRRSRVMGVRPNLGYASERVLGTMVGLYGCGLLVSAGCNPSTDHLAEHFTYRRARSCPHQIRFLRYRGPSCEVELRFGVKRDIGHSCLCFPCEPSDSLGSDSDQTSTAVIREPVRFTNRVRSIEKPTVILFTRPEEWNRKRSSYPYFETIHSVPTQRNCTRVRAEITVGMLVTRPEKVSPPQPFCGTYLKSSGVCPFQV